MLGTTFPDSMLVANGLDDTNDIGRVDDQQEYPDAEEDDEEEAPEVRVVDEVVSRPTATRATNNFPAETKKERNC